MDPPRQPTDIRLVVAGKPAPLDPTRPMSSCASARRPWPTSCSTPKPAGAGRHRLRSRRGVPARAGRRPRIRPAQPARRLWFWTAADVRPRPRRRGPGRTRLPARLGYAPARPLSLRPTRTRGRGPTIAGADRRPAALVRAGVGRLLPTRAVYRCRRRGRRAARTARLQDVVRADVVVTSLRLGDDGEPDGVELTRTLVDRGGAAVLCLAEPGDDDLVPPHCAPARTAASTRTSTGPPSPRPSSPPPAVRRSCPGGAAEPAPRTARRRTAPLTGRERRCARYWRRP